MSLRTTFEKFENQQKTSGKLFWTNFVKSDFSENFRQILGESSATFVHAINKLFISRIARDVPYREILRPCFLRTDLARRVHALKTRA